MTNDDAKTKAALIEEVRALRAEVEAWRAANGGTPPQAVHPPETSREATHLQIALEAGRAGAFSVDLESGDVEWSPELEALYGMAPGTFGGRVEDWEACLIPEDLEIVRADVQRAIREQEHWSAPFRILRGDTGEIRWLQVRGRILHDGGAKSRIVGVVIDITDLRRYELELERVQRLYAALSEINQAVVRLRSRPELFRVVCRALVEHGGFSLAWLAKSDDARNATVEVFHSANGDGDEIPKDALALTCRALEDAQCAGHAASGDLPRATEFCTPTAAMAAHPIHDGGQVAWVLGVCADDPDFFGDKERALLREAALDISFALDVIARDAERAEVLDALKAGEERLSRALANTSAGLWEWRIEPDVLILDDYWIQMFGYTKDELEPLSEMKWTQYCHPDDLKVVRRMLGECLRGVRPAFDCECRFRHRDGTWRWILSRGRFDQWSADGKPLRMVGTYIDITERMHSKERLAHAHDLMHYVISHARNATAVLDRDLRYIYVSEHFVQDYKVPDTDIIGKHHYELFPEIPPHWREVHQRALAGEVLSEEEEAFPRADGSVDWVRWECRPWYLPDGAIGGIVLSTEVITDRKRAEEERNALREQLMQSQKMESVGRLAGGVAHDFNNMLAVILGNTELALDECQEGEPLHVYLKDIQHAAQRSAELTRQLLAFARRQTLMPQVLDLNDTIAAGLKMLRRIIGEDIELAWLPGMNLHHVYLDPGQVNQILTNLLVNARDAIEGVGNVTIETNNVAFDEAYCASHAGFEPGEYVLLAVSDSGSGMDAETRKHLFEPFFTTKSVGKGTGLGLATVYGAVTQSNGLIHVYSELGKGTTFRIYFPRHQGPEAASSVDKSAAPIVGGNETILLVEDEPAMLNISQTMLTRLGYHVLTASSPEDAVKVAEQYEGVIHLLITDIVMPQMNGRQLADQLHAVYPEMKQLFMSGYPANAIAHHGILESHVQFIQKPFALADLARGVREALR